MGPTARVTSSTTRRARGRVGIGCACGLLPFATGFASEPIGRIERTLRTTSRRGHRGRRTSHERHERHERHGDTSDTSDIEYSGRVTRGKPDGVNRFRLSLCHGWTANRVVAAQNVGARLEYQPWHIEKSTSISHGSFEGPSSSRTLIGPPRYGARWRARGS